MNPTSSSHHPASALMLQAVLVNLGVGEGHNHHHLLNAPCVGTEGYKYMISHNLCPITLIQQILSAYHVTETLLVYGIHQ